MKFFTATGPPIVMKFVIKDCNRPRIKTHGYGVRDRKVHTKFYLIISPLLLREITHCNEPASYYRQDNRWLEKLPCHFDIFDKGINGTLEKEFSLSALEEQCLQACVESLC